MSIHVHQLFPNSDVDVVTHDAKVDYARISLTSRPCTSVRR